MVVSKFEEAIDKWIERNEDTATGRKELFELNGRRKELDVYRLPLELLRYNIRNGRFAAELRELESRDARGQFYWAALVRWAAGSKRAGGLAERESEGRSR